METFGPELSGARRTGQSCGMEMHSPSAKQSRNPDGRRLDLFAAGHVDFYLCQLDLVGHEETCVSPVLLRERAAKCERLAAEAQDPRARETFLYVASGWRALIAADEEFDRRRNPCPQ